MACRIGITTRPEQRKAEWEREYPNLYGWNIIETYDSKSEAQSAENRLATKHNCEASPGGDGDALATWYVYKFNY